ncbi:hypothetical protein GZL_01026 [Streptomyces sp. 769]|nr:hypothetical protein GZL_01026 [Streptomyces sp. 769]
MDLGDLLGQLSVTDRAGTGLAGAAGKKAVRGTSSISHARLTL